MNLGWIFIFDRINMLMKVCYWFIIYTLIIAFPFTSAFANFQSNDNLQKLDPLLKSYLIKNENVNFAPAFDGQERFNSDKSSPIINAMIKINGNPNILASTGIRIRSKGDRFVTADVPVASISKLISLPNVVYVQSARKMQLCKEMSPKLDISVPEVKADQAWTSTPSFTGRGVIVGIIDTGIDWSHPDFLGADGKTRIQYIWDQTVYTPGRSPDGFYYGTEWTKDDIDAGVCGEMDGDGHGTHIAGIIAGNGKGYHKFTGVAPEAEIIVVKSSFSDSDIYDSAVYIFNKAEKMGKPAVINMSFGSQWGPHDGTDILDQALDQLLDKPKRSIVASAGNDGGKSVHVGTRSLRSPIGENYPWISIRPLIGARILPVEIWYEPRSSIAVRLLIPSNINGDVSDLGIGWVKTGQYKSFTVNTGPLKGAEITIDATGLASENLHPNFNYIFINISTNDNLSIPIDDYYYAIEFDGAGYGFDAYTPYYALWASAKNIPNSAKFPDKSFLIEGDGYKTVISPSSANRVISVASYITKSEWINSENRITNENLSIGRISAWSSKGPSLNGVQKPEISAPGEMITASLSKDGFGESNHVSQDGMHVTFRGTSMSAPHVAGAIALLFQQNQNLSISEIRDKLFSSAIDQGPVGWDKAWGFGKLDVLSALNIPSVPRIIEVIPSNGAVTIRWQANPESNIAGYKLYTSSKFIDVGNVTSYTLNNLTNGVSISISLSAYNYQGNESAKSPIITVTPDITKADIAPPQRPKNLVLTPFNNGLKVEWSAVSDCDLAGYRIYYGYSPKNYNNSFNVYNTTSWTIDSLTNGVEVFVAVSAFDLAGNESEKSSEASAIPQVFQRSEIRYQSGFPLKMNQDIYSSPTVYDVDSDGKMEIAFITRDGRACLVRYDGSYMPGWPMWTYSNSTTSPAIYDIDGDSFGEIVMTADDVVYVWNHDGTHVPGWHLRLDSSIIASPAIGDIDGDKKYEIIVGTTGGMLYAFKANGLLVKGYPIDLGSSIRSTPALADIDNDSQTDIVVCSNEGYIFAFKGNGDLINGWPLHISDQIYSSPALGDIDGDGNIEIVIASANGALYVFRKNGDLVSGFPIWLDNPIFSSPAIGDIDGDGSSLEIVTCTRDGTIYVFKNDGKVINGFPVSVTDRIYSSPALCDIDGNGDVEIIVATSTGLGYTGLVYAFNRFGERADPRFPLYIDGNITDSSPAVADLDGDGDVEIIVGSCRYWDGTGGQLHVWDLSGSSEKNGFQWSGFQHDSRHTGYYDSKSSSLTIVPIYEMGQDKRLTIYVASTKKLTSPPSLIVKGGGLIYNITLTKADPNFDLYIGKFIAEEADQYTFIASGTDINGISIIASKIVQIKDRKLNFALYQNYPNPFNPETWIPFELKQEENVIIRIYRANGEIVRTLDLGTKPAGVYISKRDSAYWDGRDDHGQKCASGVYFYTIEAGEFRTTRKMTIVK
ncbi:TPA: T9SS type A sorting domain-containing protein [Candidatus Poribacteria bacterium]|nr:T9SS type A sorting domain-containing protein [Candidatus Poribacteria bacterium]